MPTMSKQTPTGAAMEALALSDMSAMEDAGHPIANLISTSIGPIIGEMPQAFYFSSQHRMGVLRGLNATIEFEDPKWSDPDDTPEARRLGKILLKRWKERYTVEERKLLNQAYQDHGSNTITFNYVAGPPVAEMATTGWVWYATDSEGEAFVIRWHMEHVGHDWLYVKEIPQTKYIKVGDKNFATNDLGKKLALEEMEATDQPMELIAKAS